MARARASGLWLAKEAQRQMVIQLSQRPNAPSEAKQSATNQAYSSPLSPRILTPLKRALQETARSLNLAENAELSVLLAGDEFLQELNREYRGLDKPTDVLSFPQEDHFVLGDVVISVETAARQAQRAHWPLPSEL